MFLAGLTGPRRGRWRIDFETGAAVSGYNDVRIPGDTGTKFSLTDDLSSTAFVLWRLRADSPGSPPGT